MLLQVTLLLVNHYGFEIKGVKKVGITTEINRTPSKIEYMTNI